MTDTEKALIEAIDLMTNEQRIELRTKLEAQGQPVPRNLYFNYSTQEWI